MENNNSSLSLTGGKLDQYISCPYKFYLANVRKLKKPFTKPAPLLSFDQAIHKSLSSYYKFHNNGEPFIFAKLLKCLDYNWHKSDFENEEISNQQKETAAKFLKTYFETFCENKEDLHVDLDNFFKTTIEGIAYGGKIDRIDKAPDGTLEIIDYKTGKMPQGGLAELEDSLAIQMLFLAADQLWPFSVNRLTYIYLKDNQVLYVERNKEKIEAARKYFLSLVENISNNRFEANPSVACNWCDYKTQCPNGQKFNLSLAKLKAYIECPQKYSFKYLKKHPVPPSDSPQIPLLFYSYITNALAGIYKERKIYSTDKLIAHAQKALSLLPNIDKETNNTLIDYCQSSFININNELAKEGFPNQSFIKAELNADYENLNLSTKVDRLDYLHNGKLKVVVYKTSKQPQTLTEVQNDITSAYYWFLANKTYPNLIDCLSYKYIISGVNLDFVPSPEVLARLDNCIQLFLKEKAFEGSKGSLCSWCDYYGPCPLWVIKPHEQAGETQEEFRKRIRLSYSKMSLYLNCPRSYKKTYVDHIPSKPQPYFSFGTAIHETFEHIYDPNKENPHKPRLEELLTEWEKVRLKHREGYGTPELEEKYRQDGIRQLTLYYNQFIKDKDFKPAHAIEEYFEIPCGKYAVMTGFIDRIDKLEDGSYEILDYKTEPSLRSQEEVDKDKQLSIYFWATEETLGLKVSKLSLLMLDHDKKIETTRLKESIPEVIKSIDETAFAMLNETQFAPKKNKYCKSCDHLEDCPLKEEILADSSLISMQKF